MFSLLPRCQGLLLHLPRMTGHREQARELRIDPGIEIYFCDPHMGVLSHLSALVPGQRPTLGWRTPAEALNDHLLTSAAA